VLVLCHCSVFRENLAKVQLKKTVLQRLLIHWELLLDQVLFAFSHGSFLLLPSSDLFHFAMDSTILKMELKDLMVDGCADYVKMTNHSRKIRAKQRVISQMFNKPETEITASQDLEHL